MIKIKNLEKKYGKFCLSIENLKVKKGEIFGLVGNNGAGKTTFLRSIMHLIQPDSGEIFMDEINVLKKETLKIKGKLRAYLNEKFLIPFLTPKEYIDITARLLNIPKIAVEEALNRYSELLPECYTQNNKLIRELSTGNKIRIGIIGALLSSPQFLLLDEPFANLDPTSRKVLTNLLVEINTTKNTTMIISSHDLDNVVDVCTRISILEKGKIIRDIETSDTTYDELQEYFTVKESFV